MICVLTGDLSASRKAPDKSVWLARLKEVETMGDSKCRLEVFRGDGFQLELGPAEEAFRMVMLIRSGLKSLDASEGPGLDARIAIGIGQEGFHSARVGESDGEAYQRSGPLLDSLKEERDWLKISTPWTEFNEAMNVCFQLANAIMVDWSKGAATVVWHKLTGSTTQEQLAVKMSISQPAVHKRLMTAHYRELLSLEAYFKSQTSSMLSQAKPR